MAFLFSLKVREKNTAKKAEEIKDKHKASLLKALDGEDISHIDVTTDEGMTPFKIWISASTFKPKYNFGHWSKMTLKLSLYLLPKLSTVPFTIVLIFGISAVNGTVLNSGKRYDDD